MNSKSEFESESVAASATASAREHCLQVTLEVTCQAVNMYQENYEHSLCNANHFCSSNAC